MVFRAQLSVRYLRSVRRCAGYKKVIGSIESASPPNSKVTLPPFITHNRILRICRHRLSKCASPMIILLCLIIGFLSDASGQRLAILNPAKDAQSERISDKLGDSLSGIISMTDRSASEAAFQSVTVENPFNLSQKESQLIGKVVGCNAFLIVKTETLRRTSAKRLGYYESYTAFFLVNASSGHLVWWRLANAEADTAVAAEQQVLDSTEKIAAEISKDWKQWLSKDAAADVGPGFAEIPSEGSPDAKNFRSPVPYLRIKPEYTNLAYLYAVAGTVEVGVDLDEKGNVVGTDITRWAGFGLDESVIEAVRKMNWRPAERNGKPLPAHFLLRYNFKKIDKE